MRNFVPGDLVIVKTDNVPRSHWPLARVINVKPGSDGVVRVVELKYGNGSVLTRPSARLCLLEASNKSFELMLPLGWRNRAETVVFKI